MSSRTLAEFFLMHADRHTIIVELACLFSFEDAIENEENSENLSDLIRAFEASDCSDADLLTEIIEQRRRRMMTRQKKENLLLNQIYRYIEEHLTDDMKIEELANSLHVNFNYLCRFFKYQTGMSPNTYKNQKRIERSISLLTQTEKPITTVARLCGFENSSYFAKQFSKMTGMTPSTFRSAHSNSRFSEYFKLTDILLAVKLETLRLLKDPVTALPESCLQTHTVSELSSGNSNLAVPCIAAFRDALYTVWCLHFHRMPQGLSTICGKVSRDGGSSWTPLQFLAEDVSGRIHYGPSAFGCYDGKLYLIQNQWIDTPAAQTLEIRKLDSASERFLPYRSLPISFIPSGNLMQLPNGTLILPGRTRLHSPYDNVPAVLIAESGRMDDEWRMIPVMEDNALPDGSRLICPHTDLLYCGDALYLFCRNDRRKVPLVFVSHDFGVSWSTPMRCDLPYAEGGRLCSGTLSTGENYLILNAECSDKRYYHSKLCIYFSRKHSMVFDRELVLFDGKKECAAPVDVCNQPNAVEHDGKLHVISLICDEISNAVGPMLYTIDLSVLEDGMDAADANESFSQRERNKKGSPL